MTGALRDMNQLASNAVPSQWWNTPQDDLLTTLRVDSEHGLSDEQARSHKASFCKNTFEEIRPARAWELILDGVKEPMMIVLLSIAALSFIFGKPVEAAVTELMMSR
jgi:Ca2+-transporting ATPase